MARVCNPCSSTGDARLETRATEMTRGLEPNYRALGLLCAVRTCATVVKDLLAGAAGAGIGVTGDRPAAPWRHPGAGRRAPALARGVRPPGPRSHRPANRFGFGAQSVGDIVQAPAGGRPTQCCDGEPVESTGAAGAGCLPGTREGRGVDVRRADGDGGDRDRIPLFEFSVGPSMSAQPVQPAPPPKPAATAPPRAARVLRGADARVQPLYPAARLLKGAVLEAERRLAEAKRLRDQATAEAAAIRQAAIDEADAVRRKAFEHGAQEAADQMAKLLEKLDTEIGRLQERFAADVQQVAFRLAKVILNVE